MFARVPLLDQLSEKDRMFAVEEFYRAREGRMGPLWANHSHTERTANLQHHHARRRSERRGGARRQMQMGASMFTETTAQSRDATLAAALDLADTTSCDDPLATNTGQPPPCAYSCEQLKDEYFPGAQSQPTRCFLFDPSSNTWPEQGGQGGELLDMRQQRFEVHAYVSREDGATPPASGVSFAVGEGRVCQNVTV